MRCRRVGKAEGGKNSDTESRFCNLVIDSKAEQIQYDLLNVLYGCKMALRTLDFSQAKLTIALLRERRARESLGVTAKLGAHALRSRI